MSDQPVLAWRNKSAKFSDGYSTPMRMDHSNISGQIVWVYRHEAYATSEQLTAEDVLALITEKENRSKAKLARAHSLMKHDQVLSGPQRQPIPGDVKMFVWRRDGGKCVECGSNQNLEFDHIIPVVMGGANTSRNLQLLCEGCNRAKGGSLV